MKEDDGLIRKISKYSELSLVAGLITSGYLHFAKGIGFDFSKVDYNTL